MRKILLKNTRESSEIAYMPYCLAATTLPHRDPGVSEYVRRNGNFKLTIFSPSDVGLPYGTLPRLLLIWLTTEAVKKKKREIALGKSLRSVLVEIGISSGGKNIQQFKVQIKKLFRSVIQFSRDTSEIFEVESTSPVKKAVLFWEKDKRAGEIESSVITLSEDFYESITEKPIPIDMGAIRALKNSSLGLDIYIWLTHRLSYLTKPSRITWQQLQQQFGSEYSNDKTGKQGFKRAFEAQMLKVLNVYPGAIVKKEEGGILLLPSTSHVAKGGILK